MSEAKVIKESIIARSPKGQAVLSWDSVADAQRHINLRPLSKNLTFHKQVITETPLQLEFN